MLIAFLVCLNIAEWGTSEKEREAPYFPSFVKRVLALSMYSNSPGKENRIVDGLHISSNISSRDSIKLLPNPAVQRIGMFSVLLVYRWRNHGRSIAFTVRMWWRSRVARNTQVILKAKKRER